MYLCTCVHFNNDEITNEYMIVVLHVVIHVQCTCICIHVHVFIISLGHQDCINALVGSGADINAKDKKVRHTCTCTCQQSFPLSEALAWQLHVQWLLTVYTVVALYLILG